jgi:hypothetical protein
MQAVSYPEDYPTMEKILSGGAGLAYRPTVAEGFITERHKAIANAKKKPDSVSMEYPVFGKLRSADAAKLYEMAYFSEGDVLELGTYQGLSSTIMGEALSDAKSEYQVYTADLNGEFVERAKAGHKKMKLTNNPYARHGGRGVRPVDGREESEVWICIHRPLAWLRCDCGGMQAPTRSDDQEQLRAVP